ncbi:MAG: RHS repeat-associated core domain-containing protein [Kiritimatiellae bacterium]|nr:RHS repeat-associated core domain-containing protein [Kiritimatiellia bacterium]
MKKETYRRSGLIWVGTSTNIYVYDGWRPVVEIQHTVQGIQTNLYVWGLDVSGSMAGAGGIGGLLATVHLSVSAAPTVCFPCYDGQGNVTGLTDFQGTNLVAVYDQGPFGEPLRATEAAGLFNPFRFSTKQFDPETGLYYFGYRYYSPTLGRWLSRTRLLLS